MRTIRVFFICFLSMIASVSQAGVLTAEELVASKEGVDMTYKQLMQIMGESSSMIHKGILNKNKMMVEVGANFILGHPAPNHRPWLIMREEDQESFQRTLLSYSQVLDVQALAIVEAARDENWIQVNRAAHRLTSSCISCHTVWKDKVVGFKPLSEEP